VPPPKKTNIKISENWKGQKESSGRVGNVWTIRWKSKVKCKASDETGLEEVNVSNWTIAWGRPRTVYGE